MTPKRIVIASIGSLGDLHPSLALAIELQRRGHSVLIASTPYYRAKVEALGIEFHGLRPAWRPDDPELIRQFEDIKRGPEVLYRHTVLPHIREMYDDLSAAVIEADLLIAGELVLAAPLVAEKLSLRWMSAILCPCSFLSAHDPSMMVNAPWLIHARKLGVPVYQALMSLGRLSIQHWWAPLRQFRTELRLRANCDPIFKDKFSPFGVLAMFSSALAKKQPDWPPNTTQSGFVFYDRETPSAEPMTQLNEFLAAGKPPLVFTLGSTAVHNPGNFYSVSMAAAKRLGQRAVLLTGANHDIQSDSADILTLPYAPYSQIFPSASVGVHQGGVGTTAQAMLAGRPMLFVPYGWDQPDNALRIKRHGAGLMIARNKYSVTTATNALSQLLKEPAFRDRAKQLQTQLKQEEGLIAACSAIEALLVERK